MPNWGPEMDFNVRWDTHAAEAVFRAAGELTLATLPATLAAHLRAADLRRLRASGPLGSLLASQSAAHAEEHGMTALGRVHQGLPDDLLNFHYDPVACAIAVGWPGAVIEDARLRLEAADGGLWFRADPHGRPVRVLVAVDGEEFAQAWLTAVEAAQR